jgi:hypothetical protein
LHVPVTIGASFAQTSDSNPLLHRPATLDVDSLQQAVNDPIIEFNGISTKAMCINLMQSLGYAPFRKKTWLPTWRGISQAGTWTTRIEF